MLYRRIKQIFKRKPKADHKMMLKSRDIGDGKYEVSGVIMYAENHASAIRKYRRAKRSRDE